MQQAILLDLVANNVIKRNCHEAKRCQSCPVRFISSTLRHVPRRPHHLGISSLAIFHDEHGVHSPHHVAIKVAMHEPHP
jgi:hypothetical protein